VLAKIQIKIQYVHTPKDSHIMSFNW